jgi:hypothetical protein
MVIRPMMKAMETFRSLRSSRSLIMPDVRASQL